MPVAASWTTGRGAKITAYRSAIDGLAVGHVVWAPYGDHRQHRPFDDRSWVSGFIRWGSWVSPHLPERVTRQYGYVQSIPRPVPHVLSVDQVDEMWEHWGDHVVDIRDLTEVAQETPWECTPEYMPWFVQVSHPWSSPASYQLHAPVVPEEAVPPIQQDMREIATLA